MFINNTWLLYLSKCLYTYRHISGTHVSSHKSRCTNCPGELRKPYTCKHTSQAIFRGARPSCTKPAWPFIQSAHWWFQYTADQIGLDKVNDALALATHAGGDDARYRWRHRYVTRTDCHVTNLRRAAVRTLLVFTVDTSGNMETQVIGLWHDLQARSR